MPRPSGVAFLLSQLGRVSSVRFAERLAELDLTPDLVAVLRVVGRSPGLSQRVLAERLGALPSKIVGLVDELERRHLLERRRSVSDRRQHELHVSAAAADTVAEILRAVSAHDAELTRGLTAGERRDLAALLTKVAAAQGVSTDVHTAAGADR